MNTKQSLKLSEPLLRAWLSLSRDSRFSVSQKHRLLGHFASPIEIYQTEYIDLCSFLGIKQDLAKNRRYKSNIEANIEKDFRWLAQPNHHLVCWGDEQYPTLLAQISDPPISIFASGNLALLAEPKISIVGSRRPSPVGVKIANTIATELARCGIVICSGMALGIDAVAHQATLDEGESTIAVMGCGLDIVSPVRHRRLFDQIAQKGLMISEYPLGYSASKYTFPQRNRIVSGLSLGVVIVEAADKSGTLITARLAMEQNREVFVVPGATISPQYVGSHRLLKQGAILTTETQDILMELSAPLKMALDTTENSANSGPETANNGKQRSKKFPILAHIDYYPTSINKIILESGLTASEVSSMLLLLEIEGLVAVTPEGSYIRVC